MSGLVKQKKKKQPQAKGNSHQSKFNRLLKKVAALKEKLESDRYFLDQAMTIFMGRVTPAKMEAIKALEASIKTLYTHYKNHVLNKSKNAVLKEMIEEKIEEIYSMVSYGQVDPLISAIYQDLTGINKKEEMEKGLEQEKRDAEEMFRKEMGIDIDLSKIDLNVDDDEEEIQRKIFEALRGAAIANEEQDEEQEDKPKSKKALAKELKAKELEELQKKGVGTLYKQLAKIVHPDLESCPVKKVEKEGWMKKLTVAYENQDFHGLLSLQLECMDLEQTQSSLNDDSFNLYNSVLEDQVAELQMMERALIASPRYFTLHPYFENGIDDACKLEGILEAERDHYIDSAEALVDLNQGLNSKDCKGVLLEFVDHYLQEREADDADGFDLEELKQMFAFLTGQA